MKYINPLNRTEFCKEYFGTRGFEVVAAANTVISSQKKTKTNKLGKTTKMEIEPMTAYFKEGRVYITVKTVKRFHLRKVIENIFLSSKLFRTILFSNFDDL